MNYLYSYPRSGNSFLRYCYEFVTSTKSVDGCGKNPLIEKIIQRNIEKIHYKFEYKQEEPTMFKKHLFKNQPNKNDKIVVLIRNPIDLLFTNKQRRRKPVNYIFKEIEDFYSCTKNFKNIIVIKYEDVISEKIVDIITEICIFFNVEINLENLEDLLINLDKHKECSKYIYTKIQRNTAHGKNIIYDKTQIKSLKQKINNNKMISKYYPQQI